MSSGARHDLFYIAESVRGTTPATPVMTPLRYNVCTFALDREGFQSKANRADRAITDFRLGAYQAGGDLGFELAYGEFDNMLQAVLGGTWATNVLKMGVTRRFFTFEGINTDWTSGDKYRRFRGMEADKLSLKIAKSPAIVEGTLSFVGRDMTTSSAIISGETYGSDNTNKPFDSFTGSLTEGGGAITVVTELDLMIENGLEPQYSLFDPASVSADQKRSNITGTLTARYEDATLLAKFLAETESSLVITLDDLDGNSLEIDLPRIKYTGCKQDVNGEGSIYQVLPFQALYSQADSSNIVITRTAAV